MKKTLFIGILSVLLTSCFPTRNITTPFRLNTAHLDHLYEEVQVGDRRLGAVWIYCEAPDYRHVGDEDEGFTCVDDVARALVWYCRQYASKPGADGLKKIRGLTEFLLYMQAENGYFYNFLLPGGEINKTHRNSEAVASWWSWRAFWALSELNLLKAPELKELQQKSRPAMDVLFAKMKPICDEDTQLVYFEGIAVPQCLAELGADQAAVMMVGLANYYQFNPIEDARVLLVSLGSQLLRVQYGNEKTPPYYAFLSWQNYWHAWGNSQAYALLYAGRILDYDPFIEAALDEVRYFYPYCIEKGYLHEFRLVSEAQQMEIKDPKHFTQIAYDISPMILAAVEAYRITGDKFYAQTAERLATWFSGSNPAGQAMYDPATGRTFDGINRDSTVNRNSGAESTIEALLSLQAVERARGRGGEGARE
ncbi:MAG: hypothetical protein IPN33_07800 [Saprospiraceae bacterium]|nr:hypothetical protein [Saprospiraceae bacterium]